MAKGYDPNKDYSKELQRNDLTSSERAQLEQERQNKIDDKYGGKEPNMTGSNNKFSDIYHGGGSSGRDDRDDPGGRLNYGGFDYTEGKGGLFGVPTINSDIKNYTQSGIKYQVGANMSRRPDLAGKVAISNGYTVFYDRDGYATKAVKGTADYSPHMDPHVGADGKYNAYGSWTDQEILTPEDRKRIEEIRAGIGTKYTGDEANRLANQIRRGYGYTIDKGGNVTDLRALSAVEAFRDRLGLGTTPPTEDQQAFLDIWYNNGGRPNVDLNGNPIGPGGMNGILGQLGAGFGGSAPEYEGSKWDPILDELAQQLMDMNYEDWTRGDQYAALAERYGQQGRMSMQDVLGQIASRTGGLASSYATSAAQQSYNDLMSQLEQAAMEMYGAERQDLLEKAQMAQQNAQDDYAKWQDSLAQWNADRNFQYGVYRDQIGDQRYENEWNYSREQQEQADLMDRAELLAAYGDFSGFKALGYTDAQISLMQSAYQAQQKEQQKQKSTGGSRTGGGGKKMTLTVAKDMAGSEKFTDAVLETLRNAGYSDEYIMEEYGWDGGGKVQKGPSRVEVTPTDYGETLAGSSSGDYGTAYNLVLNDIQAQWARGADIETLASIIEKALENDNISKAGADSLMRALGIAQ